MQQKGIYRTYTKGNIRYYRKEYYINLIVKLRKR